MSDHAADLDQLLANVPELEKIGTIGPVIVFGPQAFAVAVGRYSDANVPFIGASRLGDGRCVISGHDGYTAPGTESPHARTLLTNIVRWTAGLGPDSEPSVALYKAKGVVEKVLTEAGIGFKVINDAELESIDTTKYQVVVNSNTDRLAGGKKLEALRAFVKSGGGFVGGCTSWASWNRDNIRESHPGNQLVWESGLGWTSTYSVTPAEGKTFSVARELYVDTNALDAWTALQEAYRTEVDLPEKKAVQVRTIFTNAVDFVSSDDKILLRKVRSELGTDQLPVPGPKCPVKDAKIKPLLYCSDRFCQINPACSDFPGGCKAEPEPEAVTVKLEVGAKDVWHSTGLYAPAGQLVTVELEDSAKDESKFSLQIGTHRDNLYKNDEWQRFPVVIVKSSSKPGPKCTLSLTSTFGGLIYVCTEKDGPRRPLTARITGGALAPYFVLGTTTLDDWKTIRQRNTPWGEIAGKKMILTMPQEKLAALDDPETLLKQWDAVMDNFADICAIDPDRPKAYRMCADVQLSAGWMHSGYPFMIYLAAVDLALDAAKLRTAEAWGYYHEIGHNHQKPVWTWTGLTEVTNNVLCVHVLNTMFGLSWEEARPDSFEPEKLKANVRKYIDGGRKVAALDNDPFMYLTKYMQLQKKYGWDAYRRVFKYYEEISPNMEPNGDQDRIDFWIRTFSDTVGENLVAFYKSWGFNPSGSVEKLLGDLPVADLSIDQLVA